MAAKAHNRSAASDAGCRPAPGRRVWWRWFVADGLAAAMRKLFACATGKSRVIPVRQQEVTLTPEAAEVWKQVMDADSPVGKPVHRHRRLPSRDTPA